MVLCKFFQQGTCRFGSKCHNDHFDVRQIIKTDVESAINGKQWPLSTYGPFKDKPSIPNFIEDQLFEEVRLLCYEARQKNFFEQFHQQFTKEAMEASNKMKALLQMTPEIVDMVVNNCYDAPGPDAVGAAVQTNNPFANAASTAGSIFAKSNTAAPPNSIFGGGNQGNFPNTSNSGGGIFGAAASTPQASNIFGGSSAFNNQTQQPSIFGQAAKPAGSIFGGSTNTQQQPSSIFGQQQQPVPATTGNVFAQAQQQPPPGVFGGIFSNQQPQQQQQQQMFNQSQQSNIFSQPAATQPTQSSNIFAQPNQQGMFAQAVQPIQQQPPNQGMFVQAAGQQNMQQQQHGPNTGIFAQAAQQVFGQAMQQTTLQQQPANIFQQSQPNPQHGQVQQPPTPTGIFQQAALQTQNAPGFNPSGQIVGSALYSRLEDLTPEEIEAFKADCFQPGKLPRNPPPREFVN